MAIEFCIQERYFMVQMTTIDIGDRMNNAWQPPVDDSQKVQFYNPQHFHQPSVPQNESYQQTTTQMQIPQQNFNPGQANYSYPQHYNTPQASAAQYGQPINQLQAHGVMYSSNQPFSGQDYGSALSSTSQQSYNTGPYGQVPYEFGARVMPELEMKDDEPNESHGDWNDIDLDRDIDEYQSSSSSDYGGDGIDQVLTSYSQGYNNSQVPVYPVSAAREQYQHAFMPSSNIINHGYTDMVDASVPVSSTVPPPRPLPESLMLSGMGETQSSVPHTPLNQTSRHDHPNAEPVYAVNDMTDAVDNLTISSTEAQAHASDRPLSPNRNVEVNSVPCRPECEDKSNEHTSNVITGCSNNPTSYDCGEYRGIEKDDHIVHGSDVGVHSSYIQRGTESAHLNPDKETNLSPEMESSENVTDMQNYISSGDTNQSEVGAIGVTSNENSVNLGGYFNSEQFRSSLVSNDSETRRKTTSTSSDHDTKVPFHSIQPLTVNDENIFHQPSMLPSSNEVPVSHTQDNDSISEHPNTLSHPDAAVTSIGANLPQSGSTIPTSQLGESFNPLNAPQSPTTSDVPPQFSPRNESLNFGGQEQLPIQHQHMRQLYHSNTEFRHQDQQQQIFQQEHEQQQQQQQQVELQQRQQLEQQLEQHDSQQQKQQHLQQQLHLQDSQHQQQQNLQQLHLQDSQHQQHLQQKLQEQRRQQLQQEIELQQQQRKQQERHMQQLQQQQQQQEQQQQQQQQQLLLLQQEEEHRRQLKQQQQLEQQQQQLLQREQEQQRQLQQQQQRIQSARSSPSLLQNQQKLQSLYQNDPLEEKPVHPQQNSVLQAASQLHQQAKNHYLQHQMSSEEHTYSQQPYSQDFRQSEQPQQQQPTLQQHYQPEKTTYQQQPQHSSCESQAYLQQLQVSEEIHGPLDLESKESEDDELRIQLQRIEQEELEIERRKKLLSLELEEQELKARKRELMLRKQGSSQPSQVHSQSLPPLNDRLDRTIVTPSDNQTLPVESPIQSQPKKQIAPPRLDNQQRKPARTQQSGAIKPSEELRQIMSNMRPSPKKAPSVTSARGPSRQSSVMSDKNSMDNSDIMSARKPEKEKSKNRAGDFSLSQYQMYRPYGMPTDPMYSSQYHDNSSRAGSEYGAPIDRSPSRGSNASYEPWHQMYMQQQQAWYHHYHNNKRGETGYGGWSFATGWPSFEQWYHAMYMQQNQAYYQWWEQYYSGGAPSGSQGDSGYLGYSGYPGFGMWGPVDQNEMDRSGRGTPRRYLSAHCAVSLNLAGVIIQVCANRADEGEPARVQFMQMPIMDREDYVVFPGPLQRSETIPSDVRAFLRTKYEDIQQRMPTDLQSAYLLIAYLELLIKNRGTVLGIDVVDLLLEGHIPRTKDLPAAGPLMRTSSYESLVSLPPSGRSTPLSGMGAGGAPVGITDTNVAHIAINAQERSLDDYRKLLLCGRKRQALHYACKHSLWGHALYLAQEMGPDVLESTRSRFNQESVNPHDPIRTFYQFSGRLIPEVSTNYNTSVGGNWGDWRPHLAMLVANQDENPELAASSIIHLGDSLGAQQLLFASQLCYLIASCEFGILENKSAKISMISIDHRRNQCTITDEAIQLTEVFEYAMSLAHRDYCIPSFQLYKFIYATRLLDAGLVEESFKYLSIIGFHLMRAPQCFSVGLADAVLALGDRLQYHPACANEYPRDWVDQLRSVRQSGQFGAALDDYGNMLHGSRPVVNPPIDQTDGFVQNELYQSAHPQSNDSTVQQNQYLPQAQQQQNEQLQQSTTFHQQQQPQQQAYHIHQTNVYQQPHVRQQQQQVSSLEDSGHHHEIQNVSQSVQPLSQTDNTKSHTVNDSQPSAAYQHRDVVSQAIPEQSSTVVEPAGAADNVPFFNPSASQQSMHFYNPGSKPPASDSAPPSPGSINPHVGDAFDYFSSVNQLVQPGRQRTVSGSSSSGGPSSPSASISLGQGAFKDIRFHKYSRYSTGSSIGSPSHSISMNRGSFRNILTNTSPRGSPRLMSRDSAESSPAPTAPRMSLRSSGSTDSSEVDLMSPNIHRRISDLRRCKTYTRQSPTRSRTTSVASSGGQRSRHSSAADHVVMPPPARPAPRKITAPSMDVQNPPQQTNSSENTAPDQNPNEPENQKGVFKKIFGFFRPHNEVHLPDDKKPAIIWDSQKKEWVNQAGPDESSVVTAPPKLSQMPNPGEMNFRSGGIGGRGASGRYVDVLAQSKSTSGTSGSQMPPMLSSNPGQGIMAPPGPMPVPSMPQNRGSGVTQPQFFVPGPALSQPMPQ